MANQTGQGVAIPELNRQTPEITGAPAVSYGTTPKADLSSWGSAMGTLSDVLKNVNERVNQRLDIQAAVEGQKAGTLAGLDGNATLQDESTIRGRAFDAAAKDAVQTKMELDGRLALSQYELDHPTDPMGFKKKSDGFMNGTTSSLMLFDPATAQRFQADYMLQQQNAIVRITDRHRAVVKDQQTETNLLLADKLSQDQAQLSSQLFKSGPENVMPVMAQMISNAAKIHDLAHTMGPDGTPVFDGRERYTMEKGAEHTVSEQIGVGWLQAQPDMQKALDDWNKGQAVINVTDAKGNAAQLNLKNFLSPTGYALAQKTFIDGVKSNLALQSQLAEAHDRAFKDTSNTKYTELAALGQNGLLTLPVVEAAKASLEPDRYVTLREMALQAGPKFSDGRVVSELIARDVNGEDIRPLLRMSFKTGQVNIDDYTRLYDRNTERLDKGVQTPVAVGRDFVSNGLGKMATVLGPAQSALISQADGEYAQRVEDFKTANKGRLPTTSEAIDIGKEVVRRYAPMDMSLAIAALPTPKYMSTAEKFNSNLSSQDITKAIARTKAEFLKLHNGNVEQMKADEAYRAEAKLLTQYLDLTKMKETNNGK